MKHRTRWPFFGEAFCSLGFSGKASHALAFSDEVSCLMAFYGEAFLVEESQALALSCNSVDLSPTLFFLFFLVF